MGHDPPPALRVPRPGALIAFSAARFSRNAFGSRRKTNRGKKKAFVAEADFAEAVLPGADAEEGVRGAGRPDSRDGLSVIGHDTRHDFQPGPKLPGPPAPIAGPAGLG